MDGSEPGPSGVKIFTRNVIYNLTKECAEPDFARKLDSVETKIVTKSTFPVEEKEEFLRKFSRLKSEMKARWQAAKRTEKIFLKNNHDWLQGMLKIPYKTISNVGRPQKDFEDLSERSKRRKTEHLRLSNEAPELLYASQMALRETGNVRGAKVVKDIMSSPKRGDKYLKAFRKSDTSVSPKTLTNSQALSIFVEASLTRKQYEIIRSSEKKLYPCYSILQKAKSECYPDKEAYRVTATCAEVELQALLNITVARLLAYLEEVLNTLSGAELASLELIYKWGCDGSQQVQYKQKFESNSDSDSNIFQSCLVPVRLTCETNNKVIWQNPTPSSPRFCRPMRIRYIHETKDITNEEIHYFQEKIKRLQDTKIKRGNSEVSVKHKLLMTMVDGKVCNAATQTASTMRCYICKATSKQFNDLKLMMQLTETAERENLQFGLSVLHARIRFFETLLHLSYKITIKKWQVRTQADKDIVKARKQDIQDKFKNELGLIVDVPKPGYGSSNDGNTSRRFFSNAEVSSNITGIDQRLIEKFATILEVISSGHKVNLEKFESYCMDTAKLYVELYSWQPMTPTVHKILVHEPTVIRHALLPIGTLSEEASEARNKHFRQFRQNFSRKFSREQCNMDILNRLLLTSDPFLSSIRPKPPKTAKPFSFAAKEMLLPSEVGTDEDSDDSDADLAAGTSELNVSHVDSDEGWAGSSE